MQNLFGTDGIRNIVGQIPFNDESIERLSKAIGTWILHTHLKDPLILMAHDTRQSAFWIKAALKYVFLRMGISLYDVVITTTPSLYVLAKLHPEIVACIMISASHNPYDHNGIKVINGKKGKLSSLDEEFISHLFYQNIILKNDYHNFGSDIYHPELILHYQEYIISHFAPQFLQGTKIVLDCAHGAATTIAPEIFTALGAQVIVIGNTPNGYNINDHYGAVHPHHLQHAVIENGAAIGFAFDGDADRVIAVNSQGIIKDGDDFLSLLLDHPHYQKLNTIVGTVMTNFGLEHYLHQSGKTLARTQVGDKYIADYLDTHDLILGGEQSGHIIMKDYLNTGDGIFTALRIMETIILTQNWKLETFMKYPQVLVSVPIAYKKNLADPELALIIEHYQAQLSCGRLLVRYSGTENLLRVMIEDENLAQAQQLAQLLALQLQKQLT